MIWVLLILLIVFTAIYVRFLVHVRRGLDHLAFANEGVGTDKPVTVVIAARNEAQHIEACLTSVFNQEDPAHHVDVVVVDDGSTDGTKDILCTVAQQRKHLTIVSLSPDEQLVVGRKPFAIAQGVKHAKRPIILTTDADCRVGPRWVRSMTRKFGPDIALVAGPIEETRSSGLLSKLSRLEFFGLITTAAGLIGNKTPIFANGANMAFTRDAYIAATKGDGLDGFCDDETLMQRIKSRNLGSITFCTDPGSIVSTSPNTSFITFWQQRVRWASKKGHYDDGRILSLLVALYSFFLLLLTTWLLSFWFPFLFPVVVLATAFKIVSDIQTLRKGVPLLGEKFSLRLILLAEIFHVPYIVIAAFWGQFGLLTWKGRTLHR